MKVRELAEWLGTTFEGDGERAIERVAPLESAGGGDISFAGNRKALREAHTSAAGCLVVPLDFDNSRAQTVIRVKDPRGTIAKVVLKLQPPPAPTPGVHPTAVLGSGCVVGEGASIGPYCVLGDNVTVGPDSRLYPHVTIYSETTIGARAVIHSGTVIGADGFGFVMEKGRYQKFPQVGRVVIGDDVEIGANCAVDRAAIGVTSIGNGTKLDNMVHIGHNCRIGDNVIIVAQTGIAGGCVVEDYVVLGGQVGIGDNVTIKARAVVGSKAGILPGKILKGDGETYWGVPVRPLKEHLEMLANVGKISGLRREVAELKARLEAIEKKPE